MPFSLEKIFIFLFVTLGPLKIIGPFASMTRGRDAKFKRKLALQGFVISTIAVLVATTVAASILEKWGISIGALTLTAGIILFLVALKPLLEQYAPADAPSSPQQPAGQPAAALPSPSDLAFSPLAFPTIVTPYGIAVLILLATLQEGGLVGPVLVMAAIVLVLDLVAMLSADRILKTPMVAPTLGIIGAVLGVLQVALGVQAVIAGLRVLGIVPTQ